MDYKRLHEQSQALQLLKHVHATIFYFLVDNNTWLNVIYVLLLKDTYMAS